MIEALTQIVLEAFFSVISIIFSWVEKDIQPRVVLDGALKMSQIQGKIDKVLKFHTSL